MALPATAWADRGDRERDDRRSRDEGDDRHDGRSDEREERRDRGKERRDRRDERDDRRDEREERRDEREERRDERGDERDDGFVAAASVQAFHDDDREVEGDATHRGREQRERTMRQQAHERREAQRQAARERKDAEREREAEREQEQAAARKPTRERESAQREGLELDRVVWSASSEARLEAERLERELRGWLDGESERPSETSPTPAPEVTPESEPAQDQVEVVATAPEPPSGPATPTETDTAATGAETGPTAAPDVDVLAHERGVVGRTFRAGGLFLRDTGRAVVSAIPPEARTFSLPLGLLAGAAGWLVIQRRFRPGTLPMSAAAVPEQEGARERHRL